MSPTLQPTVDAFEDFDQPFVLESMTEEAAVSFGLIIMLGVFYVLIIFCMLRVGVVASTSIKDLEQRKRQRQNTGDYSAIMASLQDATLQEKGRGLSDASDDAAPAATQELQGQGQGQGQGQRQRQRINLRKKTGGARLRAMSVIENMNAPPPSQAPDPPSIPAPAPTTELSPIISEPGVDLEPHNLLQDHDAAFEDQVEMLRHMSVSSADHNQQQHQHQHQHQHQQLAAGGQQDISAVMNPLHSPSPTLERTAGEDGDDAHDLREGPLPMHRVDSGISLDGDSLEPRTDDEAATFQEDQDFLLTLKRVASTASLEASDSPLSMSRPSSTNSLSLQLPQEPAVEITPPLALALAVEGIKAEKKKRKKGKSVNVGNDASTSATATVPAAGIVTTVFLTTRKETRQQKIMNGLKTLKGGEHPLLRVLSLSSLDITDAVAKLIAAALRRNISVTELDLSNNHITVLGCVELAGALGKLSLNTLIAAGVSVSSPVKSGTNGNSPRSGGSSKQNSYSPRAQPLPSSPVVFNTTLKSINLSGNAIGSKGASALAEALRFNTTLTWLDVGFQTKGKKIGPDGATAFATLLHLKKRNGGGDASGLLTLKMARSNICFEGARHLSSALCSNTTLTELDIGHINYIGNSGAMQLGQALVSSPNSKLAWLCVGSHRLPIAPLVGDKRLYNKMEACITAQKRLSNLPEKASLEKRGALEKALRSAEKDLIAARAPLKSLHPKTLTLRPLENKAYLHNIRSANFMEKSSHGMDDELGVFIATLLKRNCSLETLSLGECVLPIQRLQGYASDVRSTLDLSNRHITNVEAIIVGSLVADNKILRVLNLRGNKFASSEGENFIAYALEKNSHLRLDLARWPKERMHYDGYLALASIQGMSASGAKIEPQRLEGLFYRTVTGLAGITYYLNLCADIVTINIFKSSPETYRPQYVQIASVLVCLPTTIYSFNCIRNAVISDYTHTFYEVALTVLQITPGLQAWECVIYACETTGYLDYKYVQGVYKQAPWICLKTYIVLEVAVNKGMWDPIVLTSIVLSLISITMTFIMVYDRKNARRLSYEPMSRQPKLACLVADLLTFAGMGNDTANVAQFVNYDSLYTAHYCISYVYQIAGLGARAMAISWICATADAAYTPVFLFLIYVVRVIVLLLHDSNLFRRTLYNNFVHVLSLCVTDSAWSRDQDLRDPVTIRACFVGLSFLSTIENLAGVLYAAFLHPRGTRISHDVNTGLFILCLGFMGVRWFLLLHWALVVHFPELNRKRHPVRPVPSPAVESEGEQLKEPIIYFRLNW